MCNRLDVGALDFTKDVELLLLGILRRIDVVPQESVIDIHGFAIGQCHREARRQARSDSLDGGQACFRALGRRIVHVDLALDGDLGTSEITLDHETAGLGVIGRIRSVPLSGHRLRGAVHQHGIHGIRQRWSQALQCRDGDGTGLLAIHHFDMDLGFLANGADGAFHIELAGLFELVLGRISPIDVKIRIGGAIAEYHRGIRRQRWHDARHRGHRIERLDALYRDDVDMEHDIDLRVRNDALDIERADFVQQGGIEGIPIDIEISSGTVIEHESRLVKPIMVTLQHGPGDFVGLEAHYLDTALRLQIRSLNGSFDIIITLLVEEAIVKIRPRDMHLISAPIGICRIYR